MCKVYMKITNDKYELPIAIADTVGELAKMCGVTTNNIYSAISHRKSGERNTSFVRVEFDEEEEL